MSTSSAAFGLRDVITDGAANKTLVSTVISTLRQPTGRRRLIDLFESGNFQTYWECDVPHTR